MEIIFKISKIKYIIFAFNLYETYNKLSRKGVRGLEKKMKIHINQAIN